MPAAKKIATTESPAKQLESFIAKYDPTVATLARACRAAMRKKLPTANELVYDNYQFFISGIGARWMFLVNVNDGATWNLRTNDRGEYVWVFVN